MKNPNNEKYTKEKKEVEISQKSKNKTKKSKSISSNSDSSSNSNISSSSSSEVSNEKMKYKSKRLKRHERSRSRSRSNKKKESRKRSHEYIINTKINKNSSSSESSYLKKRKRYESEDDEKSNRDKSKKYRYSYRERKKTRNSNRDSENRRYKQNEFYTASEDDQIEQKIRNKREEQINRYKREDKGKGDDKRKEIKPPIIKEKPNFNATGILAKETNTLNGVVLKFTEPLDSAEPTEEWRLYSFKESDEQDILPIDNQSFYLIGKDERICNILVLHPSCSRQHAVIQYRKTEGAIRPYILDLESTNGTFIDKERIEPARYYELRNYDLINFGMSSRDYILIKGDSIDYSKLKK